MKEYTFAKTNYQILDSLISSYLSLKNSVKAIDKYGFTIDIKTINTQIQTQIDINLNLIKQYKEVQLSRCIDPKKDYCGLNQPVCGFKKKINKSFEDCVRCEVLEEMNIVLDKLFYICLQEGYKEFPDGKTCLYRTAIYFSIIDGVVLQRIEPEKNEDWITYDLKELSNLKVTSSVETKS
ncbi:21638_t:CDS:2 [Dentiscutata erythropus]|uniref:21638_t:CDS:1 n=1 Tax=Dentiscutata erythropus TaxID=1348616 RepID=A0A9N9HCB5_9GLOM|nr:21638_t:CDS:2 [Dentiscutata erythropus]